MMRKAFRKRHSSEANSSDITEFQSDLDALVGEPVPWILRYWPFIAASLIASIVLCSSLTKIDVVVVASGRILSDVPPVVLQPLGSAVLREVRVKAGETVEEGQVLAVLDSTFTSADRDSLEAQKRSLSAQEMRLRSELSDRPTPQANINSETNLQNELQTQRKSFMAARKAALDADLHSIDAALRSERESGVSLEEKLSLAREVEQMRSKLAETQVGSKLSLLEARAARLAVEEEARQHNGRLDELNYRAIAKRAEMDAFIRDWSRQNFEELARVGPELARVEEQLAKAERLDALTLLRAPRAGTVLEVARRAPGSLVREGEPVITLVPSDVPLIAEVALHSSDIGNLQPGGEVTLKIDSYPWRRYGTLSGKLRAVSQESYPENQAGTGGAIHKGQIVIETDSIKNLKEGSIILPGMTLTAELKVGSRSVMGFFLEPLVRGIQESMREP